MGRWITADLYAFLTPDRGLHHRILSRPSGRIAGSEPEIAMTDLLYLSLSFAAFGGFAALIRGLGRM
jgi:hypothetical protein